MQLVIEIPSRKQPNSNMPLPADTTSPEFLAARSAGMARHIPRMGMNESFASLTPSPSAWARTPVAWRLNISI